MKKIFVLLVVFCSSVVLWWCSPEAVEWWFMDGVEYWWDEVELEGKEKNPQDSTRFVKPDFATTMKSKCGASIDYRYCKCTFHKEMCKDLWLSRSEARWYLEEQFEQLLQDAQETFVTTCVDGAMTTWDPEKHVCVTCKDETIPSRGECIQKGTEEVVGDRWEMIEDDNETDDEHIQDEETYVWECTRDEDCPIFCEGNVMWKQWCNAQRDECVKTFDTNCDDVFVTEERFGERYTMPTVCVPNEWCLRTAVPVKERKAELQEERKAKQAQKQELTTLYEQAAAICLWTLSDPTQITSLVFSMKEIDETSDATLAVMQELSAAGENTVTAIWCTLEERLKTVDIPVIESELDALMERISETDKLVDIIESVEKQ